MAGEGSIRERGQSPLSLILPLWYTREWFFLKGIPAEIGGKSPLEFLPPFQSEKISNTRGRLRGAPAPLLKNSPFPNILTFEIRAMLLFGEGDKGGEVIFTYVVVLQAQLSVKNKKDSQTFSCLSPLFYETSFLQ